VPGVIGKSPGPPSKPVRSISSFDPVAPSVSRGQFSELASSQGNRYITNRFDFVPGSDESSAGPESSAGHEISTGHESSASPESSAKSPSTGQHIYRCEDEPIHIPGAIQSFGALLAIRSIDNIFSVRIVSENFHNVVGIKPEHLFELRCFTDVLSQSDRKSFCIRVQALQADQSRKVPDVFPLTLTSLLGAPIALFCAMHFNSESDLLVCEFELEKDAFNPSSPPNVLIPGGPITVAHHEIDEAQRLLSTTNKSKSVRALEVARQSEQPLGPMELFQILSEIQEQLGSANSLPELLETIVGLVYQLTGFHRVSMFSLFYLLSCANSTYMLSFTEPYIDRRLV